MSKWRRWRGACGVDFVFEFEVKFRFFSSVIRVICKEGKLDNHIGEKSDIEVRLPFCPFLNSLCNSVIYFVFFT